MTDLSGRWTGSYSYPDCFHPVPFTADIRDSGGALSGVTSEPHEWLAGQEAQGSIAGNRAGSNVEFAKVYVDRDLYLDVVHYHGTLDDDQCEIAGEWEIPGDVSGSFVMTRPRPEKINVAVEEEATI